MEQETSIKGLFGTPLYKTKLPENEHGFFDEAEKKVFALARKKTKRNAGNIHSRETFVLNNPRLLSLQQKIMIHVDSYFERIYCPQPGAVPYITQSWINFTQEKGSHHKHAHPNSLFSGVLYLDADITRDSITFYAPPAISQYRLGPDLTQQNNGWNSSTRYKVLVQTGDLVLFPSQLEHSVEQLETVPGGRTERASLSFNTFIRGTIGSAATLTELKL